MLLHNVPVHKIDIDFRNFDTGVPKQSLQNEGISAVHQKLPGKEMPEGVRAASYPRNTGPPPNARYD